MKWSVKLWAVAALAAAVAAQTPQIAGIPPCALTCITSSIPATKCSLTDLNCICHDTKLEELVGECTLAKCTRREGLTAKRISAEQCGAAPRDRGSRILVLNFVCFSISWAFVATRMVARIVFKVGVLGFDDLFLVLAMAFTTVGAVTLYKMQSYGLGRDVWYIDFSNFDKLLLWYWIGEFLYVWYTGFIKISLCFFFLRIFNTTELKRFIHAAIIFQSIVILTFTFVIIFQCAPIDFAWKNWDGEHQGKCINLNAASWSIAAITITLDVVVLALPIRELWRLKMRLMKKVYIMSMFCLGFVVTIISCLRLQTLIKFSNTYNITYDSAPVVYWSTLEGMFGSVALCLPTFRAFLGGVFPCWFAIQTSTTKQYSSNQGSSSQRSGRVASGVVGGTGPGNTTIGDGSASRGSMLSRFSRGGKDPAQISVTSSTMRSNVKSPTHPFRRTIDDEDDGEDMFELVDKSPTRLYHDSIA